MIILWAMTGLVGAAYGATGIWGSAIMKQPFDKEALREINLPEWVRNLSTVTYCFSGMDQALRERAASAGAQISEVNFVDPLYAYYDSKYLKLRNPGVPADRIDKDVAEYKRLGVKILAVVPPGLQKEIYNAHPEWRKISTDTTQIPPEDNSPNGVGGGLCLMGPYGDYLIDILSEIVTKYPDVAAFSFDGLHNGGSCYCKSCRDDYRRDTGQEIPKVNMKDPSFRRYQYWADRKMESMVERMQTRLKGINPNVALVTWSTNAGRYGHFLSIPRNMSARMNLLFDAPDQEFWMDETNRGNTVVCAFANAYMWAVTNHRSAMSSPYVMSHGNPYDDSSFPKQEYLRRILLAYTYGPRVSCMPTEETRKRAPYLTRKEPEPWAAMVMSDNTNCFYGRDPKKDEERYLANVFGTFRTSIEEHLPMTVINDWNLNRKDLSKYKVLVLPNTACMDENQAAAIRQFVKNGGGLVASVDTSLYDEFGDQRKDFLLADVFGAHYQGVAVGSAFLEMDVNFAKGVVGSYWDQKRSIFDFRSTAHPLFDTATLKEYLGNRSVVFKGPAASVTTDADAQVIGTMINRELGAKPTPSIVVRSYGKGKVVYMASGFDAAYYLYPYPYQRHLLAQAIRWAAPEQPRITVEAPMCVHSTFYRQKSAGERLTVHLYNDLNSSGNHAKPDDDVPLREEVVPIHDIKVTFKDYDITRVHLEPEGKNLRVTKTKDGAQVTVPKLEIHSIVVAELK